MMMLWYSIQFYDDTKLSCDMQTYQAVDEEVDGGVDDCQVAGGEVSEPLQIFT